MARAIRFISTVMLLLFIFTIGARAVVSICGCHCVESITDQEHHNCCSCEEHIQDCVTHTQALDTNCASMSFNTEQIEALTASDSKISIQNRFIILNIISKLPDFNNLEATKHSNYREHKIFACTLDWICDVGLLRAPPIC